MVLIIAHRNSGAKMSSLSYGSLVGVAVGFGCGVIGSWLLRRRRWSAVANKDSADDCLDSSVVGDGGECKLVLVVNNDLKMGKGKAAAQCSHAAVMAFDRLSRKNPELLRQWWQYGQPKVVLKTEDDTSLLQLAAHARSMGLVVSLVQDAGRTQIAPGSKTVVGIGPAPNESQVTGTSLFTGAQSKTKSVGKRLRFKMKFRKSDREASGLEWKKGPADVIDQVTGHLKLY